MFVLVIVVVSGGLGFWQERQATRAVAALLSVVQTKTSVFRDGRFTSIRPEELARGDIIQCSSGNVIPADCVVIEAKDLFVNEASLTGESIPSEKVPGATPNDARFNARTNVLFMGTYITNGSGRAVVANIGAATEFGALSRTLRAAPPEPEP